MSEYVDLAGLLDGIVKALPIDQLHPRPDARPANDDTIAALAESIGEVGLINPIRVTPREDEQGFVHSDLGYEIVAGRHRWYACERLGWRHVPCVIVVHDSVHAELAMIDENLCRAELSPAERAQQTARRKAIYLEIHPETAHGSNATGPSGQFGHSDTNSFATETAKATGKPERTVRRDAERGEKVIPEVIDMIRGTELDTGVFLDEIKKYPPNDQFAVASRELTRIRNGERDRARQNKAAKIQAGAKAEQVKNEETRAAHVAALPQAIKDHQQVTAEWRARSKASQVPDERIAELEQEVAALNGEVYALKATNAKFEAMRVQFEQGGFDAVIAGKDEEIRVLKARLVQESEDKAGWAKKAKSWQKRAIDLGWSNDVVIPLEQSNDEVIPL
ncbi:ParB/RepB/Spo0J family partition protein [Mesorhizobium marinum]|uniref:ParB N-terminal domain-containing protein n=1 Tax=Mesorhizobium marinum TaxID=3228790 RepID=A0ABV3R5H9_9HYPH